MEGKGLSSRSPQGELAPNGRFRLAKGDEAGSRVLSEDSVRSESALSQQPGLFRRERIVGERRRVGGAERRNAGHGVIEARNEALVEILDDEDETRAAVAVRPGREAMRRMEHVLHAMDDDGPLGIVGEADDALDAQEVGPMRLPQDLDEHIESLRRQGRLARDAEGANVIVVAICIAMGRVIVMMMAVIVMVMMVVLV